MADNPFDRYRQAIVEEAERRERPFSLVPPENAAMAPGVDPANPFARYTMQDNRPLPERFVASRQVQSGMRFVTSALSPLQAPQDIAFATAAGMLNPHRSPMDYYREMEWANYMPFNRAPRRVVAGDQLLRLAGVSDERVNRWGGLAMDFLADPLLAGSLLRGIGKAAKLPGLNRAADVADTAAQSMMLVGGLPTQRVVRAVRAMPGFRQIETAIWDRAGRRVWDALKDVDARFDIPIGGGRTASPAGMLFVDGGRLEGAQRPIARAAAAAEELAEHSGVQLMRAMAEAGDPRWKRMMQNYLDSQAIIYDIPIPVINEFRPEVTRRMMNSVYEVAQDIGVLGFSRRLDDLAAPGGHLRRAADDFGDIADTMLGARLGRDATIEMQGRLSRYQAEVKRVREMARRYGDDPDVVENAFNSVLNRLQQSSALEGYFASGYGPLSEVFLESVLGRMSSLIASSPVVAKAVQQAGGMGVARKAWRDLIEAGARGEASRMLDEVVRIPGLDQLPKRQQFTYRQMFGDYADVPGLNIGTWLDSLPRGHMRRAYGVFQDTDSWRQASLALEQGRVTPTRLLDDTDVLQRLASEFPGESAMLRKYIDDIMPPQRGPNQRPTGGMVTAKEVAEHMTRQGIPPEQVERFWTRLTEVADPHITQLAAQLRKYGALTVGDIATTGPGRFTGSRGVLGTARQDDLDRNTLSMLMELMDPVISRSETAVAASRSMRRTESLTELYQLGKRKGLIRDPGDATTPHWWKAVPLDQAHAYPFLGGKTVHPTLFREFNNLLAVGKDPKGFAAGAAQLRSMVSAGYLANPATTAANVAGGFWTGMLHGINPLKLAREMVDTWRDWSKMGRDLPDLAHMRDIVSTGITQTDLVRSLPRLRMERMNLARAEDLPGVIRAIGEGIQEGARAYNRLLKRPVAGARGSGILGLGAFEMSESLFRMATFRMVRKGGGSVEEARQLARFVVFDYSAQPGAVQLARDSGIFLFPAFPWFMLGRTANAAVRRPGTLAVGERMAEFVWNMNVPDEDTRLALYGGMEDWMREDKFIPVRRKERGDYSLLSLNQLMPTNTITGAPFVDSLKTLGLWGPLVDIISAFAQDDPTRAGGPGPLTGDFGRQVFPPNTPELSDQLQGLASYLWNSYAPGIARKMYRPPEDPRQTPEGFIPNLVRSFQPSPGMWGDTGRTVTELMRGRADQDLVDSLLSLSIRSTRTLATEGQLADVSRILARAVRDRDAGIQGFDRQIQTVMHNPQRRHEVPLIEARKEAFIERWFEQWGPALEVHEHLQGTGQVRQLNPERQAAP